MSSAEDEFEWVADPAPEALAQSGQLEAIVIEGSNEPDQLALLPADLQGLTEGQWITAYGESFASLETTC